MLSIMKDKIKKFLTGLLVLVFWLGIWEIAAIIYNNYMLFPTVEATFKALCEVIWDKNFILTVLFSLFRVLSGFVFGTLISVILAVVASKIDFVKALVAPIMTVAKSAPVVAVILIIWLLVGGQNVPIVISMLMVMPIIWQNLIDGYSSIDKGLSEICTVYNFSYGKRFRLLILPTLMKYLFPGLITASGLAFKSGIAAEIISMTKSSIGKEIYNAKYLLEGPELFAWVIIVIVLSFSLELIIKTVIRRIQRKCHL